MISAKDLVEFTGIQRPNVEAQAATAVQIADGLVAAFCRGRHVDAKGEYRPGVEGVVITAAARILANPEQVSVREQAGPFSLYRGEGFQSFSLAERMVLERYRKTAK